MESNQQQPCRSLFWPLDGNTLSAWQRFVGVTRKQWRGLQNQLASRSGKVIFDCWASFPEDERAIARRVSTTIAEQLGWPNDGFIPTDPFALVMWDVTGELCTEETTFQIEKELCISVSTREWEDLLKLDYGQVVHWLSERMSKK